MDFEVLRVEAQSLCHRGRTHAGMHFENTHFVFTIPSPHFIHWTKRNTPHNLKCNYWYKQKMNVSIWIWAPLKHWTNCLCIQSLIKLFCLRLSLIRVQNLVQKHQCCSGWHIPWDFSLKIAPQKIHTLLLFQQYLRKSAAPSCLSK